MAVLLQAYYQKSINFQVFITIQSINKGISIEFQKMYLMQEQFVHKIVMMLDPQQSPPLKLHFWVFVSSLQWPSPTKALGNPLAVMLPRQEQFAQWSVFRHNPQKSPLP